MCFSRHQRCIRLRVNKVVIKRHEKASCIESNSWMSSRIYEQSINRMSVWWTKARKRSISTDISQISWISSILFLIYTRFLFSKLKIDVNIVTASFVNDVMIYTLWKKIELNCEKLRQAISKAFDWARENAVKFDDSKSEMIYFELKKEISVISITLSNEITLRSQKNVKWLRIYLDKQFTFNEHVKKKGVNATQVMHLISRLQNI